MTKLHDLHALGQSVWLDYIRRSFVTDGGMQKAIDDGVRGVTSNPSIFQKAIGKSDDYDDQFAELVREGKDTDEIYEALAVRDIQMAADLLRPIYDESDGVDGYVSLEVSPTLAHETDGTIEEARRLWSEVERPNLMIKVPATSEGLPAVEQLISEGINVNITLMFSLKHYDDVAEAYIKGLERLAENGGDLSKVASVASFFVSRVESKVDAALEQAGLNEYKGAIAVANSRAAYARFLETFSGDRWEALASKGAKVQRPLWASTSTKDDAYSDVKYVDELIGPNTVNTMPPETMELFMDHGTVENVLTESNLSTAQEQLGALEGTEVDLSALTEELQDEGVVKFAQAFEELMQSIAAKRASFALGDDHLTFSLGKHADAVQQAFDALRDDNIMGRIWQHDHTVWAEEETEITNRLGWLTIADRMKEEIGRIHALVDAVKSEGYERALVLGMGGSSLAPEVFSVVFGHDHDGLRLEILDTTDPGAVLAYDKAIDYKKTLFIVATKSGGTAETLSAFKYFYTRTMEEIDAVRTVAGEHFVAITDPGSKLVALADQYQFRATFENDPDIGGRYSALSFFGLLPAALVGVDLAKLLDRATIMAANCSAENCPSEGDNNGGRLGAIMGEMARAGHDKLTLFLSPAIEHFGDWVEQLIAESTGKAGVGILPVVHEDPAAPDVYGDDRLFVYLKLQGDDTHDAAVAALESAGQPVVRIQIGDRYDLGGQFFLWEMATAVAGHRLGIHPFNQPNVEAAKVQARSFIQEYEETGKLPELDAALEADGIRVYGDVSADNPAAALKAFLDDPEEGAYVSIHAYVQPTDETTEALQALRHQIRAVTKLATTVGYGPRFLHSTGQLHKGDAGKGLFIQFTADMPEDVDIPDEAGDSKSAMSFGTLKEAQALGDRQALLDNDRAVIRFRLSDVQAGLQDLTESLR